VKFTTRKFVASVVLLMTALLSVDAFAAAQPSSKSSGQHAGISLADLMNPDDVMLRKPSVPSVQQARREAEEKEKAATEKARREAVEKEAAEKARSEVEKKAAAEKARKEAEARTAAAEKARREAEARAAAAEKARIAIEEKAAAEKARKETEERTAAEQARKDAEARAAVAEKARKEAEEKAAAAEMARKKAEAKAAAEEKARREAEEKAAAEQARQEAEARAAADRARKEAEEKAAAEKARKEAEEKAAAEEKARREAEERAVAEQERKEAEAKAAAEKARKEAEAKTPKLVPPPARVADAGNDGQNAAKAAQKKQKQQKQSGRDAVITAERTDYDRKEGVILFDRNVYVDDEQYQLHADRLFLFMDGTNDLKRLVALGNVAITNEEKNASCSRAVYVKKLSKIVMYGSDAAPARLYQGGKKASTVVGERITFWLNSEQVEIEKPVVTVPGGSFNGGDGKGFLKNLK
jgi:lipopolysaccharide transport protein LptA